MENKLTGALAIVLLVVFLGDYVLKIGSLPLGVITVAVLLLAIYDFVLSLRDRR